jgi:hypothetical protein
MKVYTYNPITGELVGISEADESPLEPGVILMPAYSTELEPPAFNPQSEIVYFDKDEKVWRKQDLDSEPPVPLISDKDVEYLKNELILMKKKKSEILEKLGLSEKEIDILFVSLPSEDIINGLVGQPMPEEGLPSLLHPEDK